MSEGAPLANSQFMLQLGQIMRASLATMETLITGTRAMMSKHKIDTLEPKIRMEVITTHPRQAVTAERSMA